MPSFCISNDVEQNPYLTELLNVRGKYWRMFMHSQLCHAALMRLYGLDRLREANVPQAHFSAETR